MKDKLAEAGAKLRRACEWAFLEDLNGAICTADRKGGYKAIGCPSCRKGWTLLHEAREEWDAALAAEPLDPGEKAEFPENFE